MYIVTFTNAFRHQVHNTDLYLSVCNLIIAAYSVAHTYITYVSYIIIHVYYRLHDIIALATPRSWHVSFLPIVIRAPESL